MEIALSSSNRTKVKISVESGDEKAKQLLNAIEDPSSFFATTQLYITFITLFLGTFAANSFTTPLVNLLAYTGIPVSATVAELLAYYDKTNPLPAGAEDIVYAQLVYPCRFIKVIKQQYNKKRGWTPAAIMGRMNNLLEEQSAYDTYINNF